MKFNAYGVYAGRNLGAYTDNAQNEVVYLLIIRGIKFNRYWAYAEWNLAYSDNTRIEI
jgi:hypothetical protein